jgi:hypothetical protein
MGPQSSGRSTRIVRAAWTGIVQRRARFATHAETALDLPGDALARTTSPFALTSRATHDTSRWFVRRQSGQHAITVACASSSAMRWAASVSGSRGVDASTSLDVVCVVGASISDEGGPVVGPSETPTGNAARSSDDVPRGVAQAVTTNAIDAQTATRTSSEGSMRRGI